MSLVFDANADSVNHGSASALDNIAAGTVIAWLYLDEAAAATSRVVIGKANLSGTGWSIVKTGTDFFVTGNTYYFTVGRATTAQIAQTAAIAATGSWLYLAATWDVAGTADIYYGSLTTAVAVDTFFRQTGSGSQNSDAALSLVAGDAFGATVRAARMRVALVHVLNRQLPIAEIRDQQFRPRPINGSQLFSWYGFAGTSTQPDWSGNGNSGTTSGVDQAAGIPLSAPFASGTFMPKAAATAHELTANELTMTPVLDDPALGQIHGLTVGELTTTAVLDAPALSQVHVITPDELTMTPVLDTPALGQVHNLTADELTVTAVLDTPALGQVHALTANELTMTPILDTPSLDGTISLTADELTMTPVLDAPALTQVHNLTANELNMTAVLDVPALTQIHGLTANELILTPILDTPTLTQIHGLTAVELLMTAVLGTPAIVSGMAGHHADTAAARSFSDTAVSRPFSDTAQSRALTDEAAT